MSGLLSLMFWAGLDGEKMQKDSASVLDYFAMEMFANAELSAVGFFSMWGDGDAD
jgi:hypothetical protein